MLKSCHWNGDMEEYLRQNSSHTMAITINLNMILQEVPFSHTHTYSYFKRNGERWCFMSRTSVSENVWDLYNGQPTKVCSYVLTVKRDKQLWHIINWQHTSVVQFWCSWLVRAGVRKWWWGRMWSDECTNWRTPAKNKNHYKMSSMSLRLPINTTDNSETF
jgi:hypothetical protein